MTPYDEIIEITGVNSGPTSIVLVGVHGNERCGVEVLDKILPNLKIDKGRVLFGYGNPRAIEANKRFIDANLNRMFKSDALLSKEERNSYEYDRAQYLKQHLRSANALLDIHASNTPESRPFLICEQNAYGIANELPIDLIVSGFDVLQPGGTDCYMNAHGKIGMCVECGYAKDPDGLNIAEEYLFSFLIAQGNLLGSTKKRKQSHIQMKSMYLTKTDRFSLVKDFDDFEKVKAGQIIGTDGDEMITAPSDAIILFARNRDKISEEAFLLGKA